MSTRSEQSADRGTAAGRPRVRPPAFAACFAALVESSPDAIITTDIDGMITSWSTGAAALFGCAAEGTIGSPSARLVPPALLDEAHGLLAAVRGGERVTIPGTERITAQGVSVHVSLTAAPVRGDDGRVLGALYVMRDLSTPTGKEPELARSRAEQEARDQRRFIDTMIESMPGILYFYDDQGRFLRWNRNFERVSGYSAEEIALMHPRDFFRAEDHAEIEARIADVFASGESSVEADFIARDGTATRYFFTGRRVVFGDRTCLVGVGIDVSGRHRALGRLAESERNYRELVQHANSIILRWNSQGQVTFLNEYGLRFFGYSEAEILGRHVMETIVPQTESDGRDLRRLMDEICAAPQAFEQNVNENVKRSGERVWIAWTNRIVRNQKGEVVEILSIGADITDRRRVEAERERRYRAEEADRIKSAFLATMSHELRTPLNSIIGFTGILTQGLAGPLNPEQQKQLDMVRASARHLLALVNDVLDISKIEAGQLEVTCEPFDLRQSIFKAVELVRPHAEARGLLLHVDVDPAVATACGDVRRVEQVLLNLMNNGIKFTPKGEIRLSAALVPGRAVRICVADTGVGIKAEDMSTLFQPFRQVDSGLARNHEGTGLGLAICRRLVELMGGEIAVESEWGRGSVFSVTLPLDRQEQA